MKPLRDCGRKGKFRRGYSIFRWTFSVPNPPPIF
jgi:hypothetical protein